MSVATNLFAGQLSAKSLLVRQEFVAEPSLMVAMLKELHDEHVAQEVVQEVVQEPAIVADRLSKFSPQRPATMTLPASIVLDGYQSHWVKKFTATMRSIGLPMTIDDMTITLTGRLCDVNGRSLAGQAIRRDTRDFPREVAVRIIIDAWTVLQWHHKDAESRKKWFDRLAGLLGYPANDLGRHDWRRARDRFHGMDDREQELWVDAMGSPEPMITEKDQFLVLGVSYFVVPA
jgi:hypothetical protein